jgi:hypothetical protein
MGLAHGTANRDLVFNLIADIAYGTSIRASGMTSTRRRDPWSRSLGDGAD